MTDPTAHGSIVQVALGNGCLYFFLSVCLKLLSLIQTQRFCWLLLSSRLTAYVAKLFAMASDVVHIDQNVICSALRWLILNKQLPGGVFVEHAPVIHGAMTVSDTCIKYHFHKIQKQNF